MGFADALDREAAWLATSPRTDGLPDLTTVFDVIQARMARTPRSKQRQLYVLHDPGDSSFVDRTTNQRAMFTHNLLLRLIWPVTSGSGAAESDQLAFEEAIDAVVTVVMDLVGDHTHGSRFLSVAEDMTRLRIRMADPAQAIAAQRGAQYEAEITFSADDFETTN